MPWNGKGACMQARGARWKQPNWWHKSVWGEKYPIRDGEATPYLLLNLLILLTLLRLLTMLQSLWALDISSPSESRSAYKCQVWLLAELTFSIFWLAKVWKKNPCIYVWIARWKGSDFEGSPTWPFPDDQLGVHLPPSLSLGPHFLMSLASRENRKTEQHVNVSRSTNHTASFWKVSFRLLGIFWNGGQMRESSKGVPKWTKKKF